MTRFSKSMVSSGATWAPGGATRNAECSPALMGSSWLSSSARANWWCPSTLPSVALIREWPWWSSEQVPGVRYARLRATSPTYDAVTLIVVNEPREEQFYVMCLETAISGPRLIRAWKRRHWIEHCFRTLKHLLAMGACQVHNEDAYYGHLVLRLMGCLVLFYTSRVTCKGRLTMEEIIFSLKHYWRFVDSEALDLKAHSWGIDEKAA